MKKPAATVAVHPLHAWREELGLSRAELARKAGVNAAVVESLENGDAAFTSCDKAMYLARALGVETDTLIQALIDFNEGERS